MIFNRRRFLLATGGWLGVVMLGACGDGDDDAGDDDPGTGTSVDDGFPVTVSHTLGTTTISHRPERVACVDAYEADVALALGIAPVAVSFFSGYDDGIPPWQAPLLADTGTVVLTYTDGYDLESTAATRPDVILGSYIDDQAYELFAAIAPTVVLDYESDIRDRVRTVASAVGLPNEAERVIDTYDRALSVATEACGLVGRSVAAVVVYEQDVLSNATDADSFAVLADIGAVPSPNFDNIEPYADIGLERIEVLDADFLFVVYGEGLKASLESNPLFAALPAVQEGRYLGTEELDLDVISARGVLQVPYVLERFAPAVQALGLP